MNRLREVRQSKGVSLRRLASEIGVSPTFLSDAEKSRRNLSNEHIEKVAKFLKVKPDQIRQMNPNHIWVCKNCGCRQGQMERNELTQFRDVSTDWCYVGKYKGTNQ